MVGKPGYSNPEGSTSLASVLHGAAALLRYSKEWDWFINLVASDYPLITQDGNLSSLICTFCAWFSYPIGKRLRIMFNFDITFVPFDLRDIASNCRFSSCPLFCSEGLKLY